MYQIEVTPVPDDLRALAVRLANKTSFAKLAKEIGVSAVSLYSVQKFLVVDNSSFSMLPRLPSLFKNDSIF
jgi:hypothetical protein